MLKETKQALTLLLFSNIVYLCTRVVTIFSISKLHIVISVLLSVVASFVFIYHFYKTRKKIIDTRFIIKVNIFIVIYLSVLIFLFLAHDIGFIRISPIFDILYFVFCIEFVVCSVVIIMRFKFVEDKSQSGNQSGKTQSGDGSLVDKD